MDTLHPAEHELAALAHRLWCEEMIAQGWRPRPFDPPHLTHDALVPFEELSVVDRHNTVIGVASLELVEPLRMSVRYARGAHREFAASELTVAMRVGFMEDTDDFGTVQSWIEEPA